MSDQANVSDAIIDRAIRDRRKAIEESARLREALETIATVLDQSGGDRYAIEARGIARAALTLTADTP